MNFSSQPISSLLPFNLSDPSKGYPLAAMKEAFSLQPGLAAQAADQVTMGPMGFSHLTKSISPAGLNPLSGAPQHSESELKQVSKNFESIFLQMLFKEMRNSVQKSDLFASSKGMEIFESMYDEQLTQKLASAGGMGLGNMVYEKLKSATVPHQKTFS